MRYRPHSGSLHPHASGTYDELFAAAQTAGLDLSGYGYRHGIGRRHDAGYFLSRRRPGNRHRRARRRWRPPLPHHRRRIRGRRVHLALRERPLLRLDHTSVGDSTRHGLWKRRRNGYGRSRWRQVLLPRTVARRSSRVAAILGHVDTAWSRNKTVSGRQLAGCFEMISRDRNGRLPSCGSYWVGQALVRCAGRSVGEAESVGSRSVTNFAAWISMRPPHACFGVRSSPGSQSLAFQGDVRIG